MEGRASSEIFGEKAEKYYAEDLQVINSATPILGIVERIKTEDGKVNWFRTDKVPFIGKDGSVRGIVVTTQDITADKEAEQRRIQQGSLLNKAKDAIIVLDLNHKVIFWNNSAERLYRWSQYEIANASIRDELYPTPETFDRAMELLLIEGEWSGEIQQKRRDGRKLTVESSWTLVRDDSGEAESILCINSDVTDRKALEQQFLRAQRLESIGTLASGIAHDLNNVLAPILLSLQMLKMDERDPDKIETLITIEASAKRGAEMVKQVLSFARGAGGTKTELQLKYLVHEIEKIVSETFAKNIKAEVAVEQSLWTVLGDSTQLHQLLLNLCVNARDAMPEGGRLTIRVQNVEVDDKFQSQIAISPGSYVSIEVEDTGCGIPPEIIDKIFDPFFTTKDVDKGTGLGLSTCMGIVKDHEGVIHVYSEPGRGSRFRVYIPARKSTSSAQSESATNEVAAGNGELILIVDDENAMRSITGKTLQAFGYNTLTACDGEEALAIYSAKMREISLVITDMMMPVIDGAGLINGIKKLNPKAKIISISGINHKKASLLDLGVRHFLLKPYTAEKLLSTIREALED